MIATLSACSTAGARPSSAPAPRLPPAAEADSCAGLRLGPGLDLVVLGSGGPRAAGRAASGYLLGVDGAPRMLIDAGPGVFARLGESGLPDAQLDTILLTHLHIDHTGDLPALIKSRNLAARAPIEIRVVGPEGRGKYPSTSAFVERLFGPAGAFAYLPSFRNELRLSPVDVPVDPAAAPALVLHAGGIRVSAVAVDHGEVPALAYRVERGGRSVVVSGDLASENSRIAELARGADVLVYDAAVLEPPGSSRRQYELHTRPRRIGEVAAAAGVRTLVLSHIPKVVEARLREVIEAVRISYRGELRVAEDCMHVPLGAARSGAEAGARVSGASE